MTLLSITPSAQTEAEVSSHEDSIPSITGTLTPVQQLKNSNGRFNKPLIVKKVKN
jgi:hypothetical protein